MFRRKVTKNTIEKVLSSCKNYLNNILIKSSNAKSVQDKRVCMASRASPEKFPGGGNGK